ncbi:hypothetical protein [Glaciimonas sp. PCH181]|uniref:hypothetical protein n=1 Tax=Glaciimonas sp. PCH181 TaxID=2133943 RepID=UPI000D38E658|nr:hypothetical protein [Glaciimonas sp. PCH181]PUA19993.1 hypothetical protein C7W93_09370 [Glaciimonas sp. PCH181]
MTNHLVTRVRGQLARVARNLAGIAGSRNGDLAGIFLRAAMPQGIQIATAIVVISLGMFRHVMRVCGHLHSRQHKAVT